MTYQENRQRQVEAMYAERERRDHERERGLSPWMHASGVATTNATETDPRLVVQRTKIPVQPRPVYYQQILPVDEVRNMVEREAHSLSTFFQNRYNERNGL